MHTNITASSIRYDNMGLVRYILAMAVMVAHFSEFFDVDLGISVPYVSYAVGGFFSLSGFLVYNSYLKRPNLKNYIARRAARILPAYSFIVLLCAFGLSALSTLSFSEYFDSLQLYKYIAANLATLNFIQPDLPGVFTQNTFPAVNGSLWTIKVEWALYFSVPVVAYIIAHVKWNMKWIFGSIYILSFGYRILFHLLYVSTGSEIYAILGRQFFGQMMYFYCGVFLSFHLDWILRHKITLLAACAFGVAINCCVDYADFLLTPAIITTLVVLASVSPSWLKILNGRNNLSYDMYLYHYPVGQTLWVLLHDRLEVWVIFLLFCLLTTLLAAVSWFGIGSRFMRPSASIPSQKSFSNEK